MTDPVHVSCGETYRMTRKPRLRDNPEDGGAVVKDSCTPARSEDDYWDESACVCGQEAWELSERNNEHADRASALEEERRAGAKGPVPGPAMGDAPETATVRGVGRADESQRGGKRRRHGAAGNDGGGSEAPMWAEFKPRTPPARNEHSDEMTWHYCLGKKTEGEDTYYHVIEVYCDEDGEPWGWVHAKPSYAGNVDEAIDGLMMMLRDCGRHDLLDLDEPMPGKGPEGDAA